MSAWPTNAHSSARTDQVPTFVPASKVTPSSSITWSAKPQVRGSHVSRWLTSQLCYNVAYCLITGPPMKIVTATKDDIKMILPTSQHSSLNVLHHEPGMQISGLDVNARTNTIYWSNGKLRVSKQLNTYNCRKIWGFCLEIAGMINKMDVEAKQRTTATSHVGRPETLAVDWTTDNVYYFDNEQKPSIKVD